MNKFTYKLNFKKTKRNCKLKDGHLNLPPMNIVTVACAIHVTS